MVNKASDPSTDQDLSVSKLLNKCLDRLKSPARADYTELQRFTEGQRVEYRSHSNSDWKLGTVIGTDPLRVKLADGTEAEKNLGQAGFYVERADGTEAVDLKAEVRTEATWYVKFLEYFTEQLPRSKRFLLVKEAVGLVVKALDIFLDIVTGIKFWLQGDVWWATCLSGP